MTDSEDEPQEQPEFGQGKRIKTPSKRSTDYRDEREGVAWKHETKQRKATIKNKRAAIASLSSPAASEPSSHHTTSMLIDPLTTPSNSNKTGGGNTNKTDKGKGKASNSIVGQMHQLLSLIDEGGDFPSPIRPGSKPILANCFNDSTLLGVEVEEWSRRRLLYVLRHRDGRVLNPHFDYEDLKKILGTDPRWDSETDDLDDEIIQQPRPSAATNVTNNTVMGEFDEEPVRRKLVQVQSIPPPRPIGAQGATSKVNDPVVSYTGTSLEGSQTNLAPKKTESQPLKHWKSTGLLEPHSHDGPYQPVSKAGGAQSQPALPTGPTKQSAPKPRTDSSKSQHSYPSQPLRVSDPARNLDVQRNHEQQARSPPVPSGSHLLPRASHSDSRQQNLPSTRQHEGSQAPRRDAQGSQRTSSIALPPLQQSAQPSQTGLSNTGRSTQSNTNRPTGPTGSRTTNHRPHNSSEWPRTVSSSTPGSASSRQQHQQQSASMPGPNSRNEQVQREDEPELENEDKEPRETGRRTGSTRSRLKDYSGVEKDILNWVGRAYVAIMAVDGMYETDEGILNKRRLKAWKLGCSKYEVGFEELPLATGHVQNMGDRLCSWHSRVKAFVRPYAESFFQGITGRQAIKMCVKELKASALHTKHEILQTCMSKILFRAKDDYGVQFGHLFKTATVQLVCFICALIQSLIEEYETGIQGNKDLNFEVQRKAYLTHSGSHEQWLANNGPCWALVQKQMTLRAFANAGASYSVMMVDIEKAMLHEEDLPTDDPAEEELAAWENELAELDPDVRELPNAWGGEDMLDAEQEDEPGDGLDGGNDMGGNGIELEDQDENEHESRGNHHSPEGERHTHSDGHRDNHCDHRDNYRDDRRDYRDNHHDDCHNQQDNYHNDPRDYRDERRQHPDDNCGNHNNRRDFRDDHWGFQDDRQDFRDNRRDFCDDHCDSRDTRHDYHQNEHDQPNNYREDRHDFTTGRPTQLDDR
ncbi:unnamed protein product [Rhizoctonia solani]|uniref:DUF6532 domain-containing protein n=1 Tax=Rhizoctonia solani TaxID=456999 RepID=A0A8H2XBQ9_9AGAM|nr:unnamed protein product [Rhizoctonia solani]